MPCLGSSVFTAETGPNSTTDDSIPICDRDIPGTNVLHCTQDPGGEGHAAARSEHPGGVNAVMCDGSVHFFQNDIDTKVWGPLCTRGRGDTVDWP